MKSQLNEPCGTLPILTRINLAACLLILVVFLGACRQEPSGAKGSDLTGTYTLLTVNGTQVPTTVAHDGVNLQVRSGSFSLNADGTCSTKTVFVPPSGAETTREASATYTRDGSKLTMRWQGAGMTTGTLASSVFTMNNEGMVLVYRK